METTRDQSAEAWLDAHGDYLYRYARARVDGDDTAADLVQEALLAAWRGRDRFAGTSSERTWLVGILKHKIADHVRREIRERARDEAHGNDPTSAHFAPDGSWLEAPLAWRDEPGRSYDNEELKRALLDCIGRLPEKQHRVFTLRELGGEETAEICNACGISTTNFHVLMHRARLALRICLERSWFGTGQERRAK